MASRAEPDVRTRTWARLERWRRSSPHPARSAPYRSSVTVTNDTTLERSPMTRRASQHAARPRIEQPAGDVGVDDDVGQSSSLDHASARAE